MRNIQKGTFLAVLLLLGAITAFTPHTASAAPVGTPSGTLITNTASLLYTVGTVTQNLVTASSPTVAVDNKINVVVTTVDGAAVSVVPAQNTAYLTFTVTNQGNTVQDYSL